MSKKKYNWQLATANGSAFLQAIKNNDLGRAKQIWAATTTTGYYDDKDITNPLNINIQDPETGITPLMYLSKICRADPYNDLADELLVGLLRSPNIDLTIQQYENGLAPVAYETEAKGGRITYYAHHRKVFGKRAELNDRFYMQMYEATRSEYNQTYNFAFADRHNREVNKDLFEAVEKGDVKGVKTALAEGAYINIRNNSGQTALHIAANHNKPEIINLLLASGADINATSLGSDSTGINTGDTALVIAAAKGKLDTVDLLCARGAQLSAKNSKNHNSLIAAILRDDAKTLEVLCKYSDVNEILANNETALMFAAATGNLKAVEILCKYGANLNIQNNLGQSPLMFASAAGHLEVVKQLCLYGADVNLRNNKGQTALIQAAAAEGRNADTGHARVYYTLISYRADQTIHDLTTEQRSATDYARIKPLEYDKAHLKRLREVEANAAKGVFVQTKPLPPRPPLRPQLQLLVPVALPAIQASPINADNLLNALSRPGNQLFSPLDKQTIYEALLAGIQLIRPHSAETIAPDFPGQQAKIAERNGYVGGDDFYIKDYLQNEAITRIVRDNYLDGAKILMNLEKTPNKRQELADKIVNIALSQENFVFIENFIAKCNNGILPAHQRDAVPIILKKETKLQLAAFHIRQQLPSGISSEIRPVARDLEEKHQRAELEANPDKMSLVETLLSQGLNPFVTNPALQGGSKIEQIEIKQLLAVQKDVFRIMLSSVEKEIRTQHPTTKLSAANIREFLGTTTEPHYQRHQTAILSAAEEKHQPNRGIISSIRDFAFFDNQDGFFRSGLRQATAWVINKFSAHALQKEVKQLYQSFMDIPPEPKAYFTPIDKTPGPELRHKIFANIVTEYEAHHPNAKHSIKIEEAADVRRGHSGSQQAQIDSLHRD